MIHRFQIQDLIVQDASGVVFRALDTETGRDVAVRRFFPFGANGGGLHAEEQAAYDIAISRLAGLSHPALRSVVCGGCDPVDGMPFIATEWIEGESLQALIEREPITVEAATLLITQALEVCELLSHVLAEEAVWVETALQTIIVSHQDNGRGFTFWISPLKWLGTDGENRGLQSIVGLTEELMGWTGQIVSDQAGRGLGAWLKWLRSTASTTSLKEARESLAAAVGVEPPPPVKALVVQAGRPSPRPPARRPVAVRKRSSKMPLFFALALVLALGGAGAWWMIRQRAAGSPPPSMDSAAAATPVPEPVSHNTRRTEPEPASSHLSDEEAAARASRRAAELSAQEGKTDAERTAIPADSQPAAPAPTDVIPWDNHQLLVENNHKPVVVEGVVRATDLSKRGKTVYLLFAGKADRNAARAGLKVGNARPEPVIKNLRTFIGKKVRVSGTVDVQTVSHLNRPDIMIDDLSAVKAVE